MSNELLTPSVTVTVGSPAPSAMILKEVLPSGWQVNNATWNGTPTSPTYSGEECKWLFGVGVPVGSGILAYQTRVLGNTGQVFAITGSLLYGTNTVATLGNQQVAICPILDTDRDGIPDDWEIRYGLNPTNTADAAVDTDSDKMTNLQEYLAYTNPTNRQSVLQLTGISWRNGTVHVQWQGGTNATQYLERSASLTGSNNWSAIYVKPPPLGVTNAYLDTNVLGSAKFFYRIRALR